MRDIRVEEKEKKKLTPLRTAFAASRAFLVPLGAVEAPPIMRINASAIAL